VVLGGLDIFASLGRWLSVGSLDGSGGNKVFWVAPRVGLEDVSENFGVGVDGGSDEGHQRFWLLEL
jgi:hypothetical protein